MLGPLVAFLGTLMASVLTLVPFIIGFALFAAGAVMAFGNHQRGKEGLIAAVVGGAIMLTSQTVGAGFHA